MSELEIDNRVAQVQVIPFRMEQDGLEVLVLQRNEAKGGFWQPVTGGIEPGEEVLAAASRELYEETGVTSADCAAMVNDGYTFEFTDMHRGVQRTFTEYVVAAALRKGVEIRLSDEHVDARWVSRLGALSLLKYPSNKDSLNHYWSVMEEQSHEW